MRICVDVKIKGARTEIIEKAVVDTGAEISLMPFGIAADIGAWRTNQQVNVEGLHGEVRTSPLIVAFLHFPSLNDIGGEFAFAMGRELIVGMDILTPLGINIDAKTRQLSVKNEVWEAFKTLAALGVLFFCGIKVLEVISEQTSSAQS